MIKTLDKSDLKTLKISFIVGVILALIAFILAFFLNWWHKLWFLSIFIGLFSASFCYIKLVYVTTNVTNFIYKNPKKAFIINNLTSLLIYFLALLICTIVNIFNIYLCFLGILILKIVIIIRFGRKPKKEEE